MLSPNFLRLSLPNWPFTPEWLPPEAYLVGGAVRDALLNRQGEYLDLDFIVPSRAVETARTMARHYKAGFVVLDEQRQIARVVFEAGTIDFAQQEGDSVETDLRRRDFTINAIAYSPHTYTLIDPLGGQVDLEKKVLRMVSPANLQDDPLRLMRAYRQAAQLNFSIEPATQTTIQSLATLLGNVAAERVQTELGYLLNNQGSHWLEQVWQAGLLKPWFKKVTAEKLRYVANADGAARSLGETWAQLHQSQWQWLAKLACLVSWEPEQAESELVGLKYSRAQIKTVITAIKHLPQLLQHATQPMSLKEQYFFFLEVGDAFPVIALLAAAVGTDKESFAPLLERYFDPTDQVAHPQPLVTGNDLINALNLSPSPKVGKLLTEIQIAFIEGRISTKEEALKFATSLLQ